MINFYLILKVEQYVFGGGRGSGWVVKKLFDIALLTTTTATTTTTTATTTATTTRPLNSWLAGTVPRQGRALFSPENYEDNLRQLQPKVSLAQVNV
jgi:hypothetical protein